MDLRRLSCFVAVYEERNMTVAAQRCFVSQPALSASIKQLEQELATPLFQRHKRGVDLTDEAHQLYPLARQLLGQAEALPRVFAERQARIRLRLANFHDISPRRLADFLARCQQQEPRLELDLRDHEDGEAQVRLTLDVFKRDEELFLPLWEEDYVLCVPAEHALARCERVTLADLNEYAFIECAACEAHQQTLSLLASAGLGMTLVAKAAHKTQVKHLVSAGVGISFLPDGVLEGSGLVSVPLDAPRMYRRIGLCFSAGEAGAEYLAPLLAVAKAS